MLTKSIQNKTDLKFKQRVKIVKHKPFNWLGFSFTTGLGLFVEPATYRQRLVLRKALGGLKELYNRTMEYMRKCTLPLL